MSSTTIAPMTATVDRLEDLRRRIDSIDDQIHDLVVDRAKVVADIAKVKQQGDGRAYRPGREAMLIRRLLARHRGQFPKAVIVSMWRELLGAALRLQGAFNVGVYRPEEANGYWLLARDHFGGAAPLLAFPSVGQVIAAVSEGRAAAGIVPLPQQDDTMPWWPSLLREDRSSPRVAGRLPFAETANAQGAEGLVVAATDSEATGDDRSLIAIEGDAEISRARLHDALVKGELTPTQILSHPTVERSGASLHLAELEGFVAADDPRFEPLKGAFDYSVKRIARIGGYAVPLRKNELAD